ncbi:MAG: hypothetical protein AAFX10_08780 [Pseudomonadota bacterium]
MEVGDHSRASLTQAAAAAQHYKRAALPVLYRFNYSSLQSFYATDSALSRYALDSPHLIEGLLWTIEMGGVRLRRIVKLGIGRD